MKPHVHRHEHPAPQGSEPGNGTYAIKKRITLVGGVINLLLSVGKIIAGFLGQSQALIADGVHSLSDLISDVMVLVAAKFGSAEPDEDHPYGHARIETLATAGVALFLLLVAAGFFYDAMQRIVEPERLWQPGWLAFSVALLSALVKEALFQYTFLVGRRLQSGLILANAWHHRSDALSSVVVIVGIGGAMLGVLWLDAVAALIVAVMIAQVGWGIGRGAMGELIDTGLSERYLRVLRRRIDRVSGVHSHHKLRTRRMGAEALADVHIRVDPELSVSEAHRIARAVTERMLGSLEPLNDVLVHVDHESTEAALKSLALPEPAAVRQALGQCWQALLPATAELKLHYNNGRINVDVLLPLRTDMPLSAQALQQQRLALQQAAAEIAYLAQVRLLLVTTPESP